MKKRRAADCDALVKYVALYICGCIALSRTIFQFLTYIRKIQFSQFKSFVYQTMVEKYQIQHNQQKNINISILLFKCRDFNFYNLQESLWKINIKC